MNHVRRWAAAHPRVLVSLIVFVALAFWGATGFAIWLGRQLPSGLPDGDAVTRIGVMDQATTIYDDQDRPVFTIFKEQRIEVPLAEVSPHLIQAIVSVEDQRFYEHRGIDLWRVAAAALHDLRIGRKEQGGSTLTQQLARQSFLTRDKTLRRKLQEIILATRIEQQYSKQEILQLYFNKVYFGDGLYGVEAASRGYFGKHASELTLPEAALLAGLVKSPSTYAPTVSPERATARRNVVLQAMRENGVIDRSQQLAAAKTKIALHDSLRREEPHGQYFKEEVRKQLVDQFGWQRVYQGGLRVFTTIDTRMQEAAEMEVERGISEIEARRKARRVRASVPLDSTQRLQGALVALDPQTCEVRAMVGGRSFEDSHFNRAVQAKRQPGSAFKPFVYAAALEAGFTPATVLDQLDDAVVTMQGMWMPEDEHSSASSMTLRTALRTSSNRAAVKLLNRVGIPNAVSYAKRMGVGEVPGVPSLALGSGEVTLVSMTAAYSAFANGGLTRTPVLIRRVEDREGHVLTSADEPPRQVIKETTSFLMASMLADVVNAGTAYRARRLGFTLPAAGKTGTTNDFNDAWFVGFTPKIVAAVWIGFDQPQTILPNGYAGELAVPIWARFMKLATKGEKPAWFTPPAGMVTASICRISGKLATPACEDVEVMTDAGQIEHRSMVYTEYFVRGTQPTSSCDIHQQRSFFDRIAGLFGKPEAPPPVRADDVDLPTVTGKGPAAAAPTIAGGEPQVQGGTIENKDEEPKKKRGFWSRVFGIGKDKSKKDKEKEKDNDKDREF